MKNFFMKTTVAFVVFVLCSFGVQAQELSPDAVARLMGIKVPPQARFVPGEIIVKMKPSPGVTAQDLTRMGVQKDRRVTSGGEIIYQIAPSVKATMSTAALKDRTLQLVREFRARPDVEYAQLNYILRRLDKTPNDPRYAQQWHYFNNGTGAGQYPGGINLPKAWDSNTGSSSVVVAVIDTGILPNHPDIQGSPNLVAGYDMITDVFTANDGSGRDSDPADPGDAVAANECGYPHDAEGNSWHGTHVAGTIGVGKTNNGIGVAGINWTVKVQAVRVLGKCGGTTSDINDAIRWAAGLPVPGVAEQRDSCQSDQHELGWSGPVLDVPVHPGGHQRCGQRRGGGRGCGRQRRGGRLTVLPSELRQRDHRGGRRLSRLSCLVFQLRIEGENHGAGR